MPLLLPAIDLLESNGHAAAAHRILDAVGKVLTAYDPLTLTPDLGGRGTTTAMTQAIIRAAAG